VEQEEGEAQKEVKGVRDGKEERKEV